MNKNAKVGIILSVLVIILCYVAFNWFNKENDDLDAPKYTITSDSLSFKNEFEADNDDKNKVNVSIKSYNTVSISTFEEIFEKLESDETYILFFGSVKDENSRIMAGPLTNFALTQDETIYYLDIYDDIDEKKLSKNKVKTVKKGSDNYYTLVSKLSGYLPAYEGLNDESIKRVYMPTIVFVEKGKVEKVVNIPDEIKNRNFAKDISTEENQILRNALNNTL